MTFPHMERAAPAGTGHGSQYSFDGGYTKRHYRNKSSSTQASDWLSQTVYWRDSLAARIADARSRVVIGLHVNEVNSIKDEVRAFKAHCAERPSFGGGA
jgi:hypothetical protein